MAGRAAPVRTSSIRTPPAPAKERDSPPPGDAAAAQRRSNRPMAQALKQAPTPEGRSSRMAERTAHWRVGGFGPASEEPYRRRVTDGIKLGIESVVLALLVLHASYPSVVEKDIFRTFNDLPGEWYGFFRAVYTLGTVWALGLAIVAAVVGRRWRLARDLLIAGVGAWAIAHALGAWVAGDGISDSFKAVTRVSGLSPEFPAARLALLVGVIATAGPYV